MAKENQVKASEAKSRSQSLVFVGSNKERLGLKQYTIFTEFDSIPKNIKDELNAKPQFKSLFVTTDNLVLSQALMADKTSALYKLNQLFN